MKNTKTQIACLAFAVLSVFSFGFKNAKKVTFEPLDKITICHMPPGNQGNCQEITISYNAFQTHMDHHDDALVCYKLDELPKYVDLADKSKMYLVMNFTIK